MENLILCCKLYSKTFASRISLRNHQLTHNGEKRYNCSQCNSANNANTKPPHLSIWRDTWWPILEKRKRYVQLATTPVPQKKIWKDTLWGSIQEKGHTSVTSATTPALNIVSWRDTWWFTQERNYSSATSAKRPSNGESSGQDTPKCIWPEYDYSSVVVVDDFVHRLILFVAWIDRFW